ncbi:putative membrane protein [Cesiribacter andamanensis AMV16]|uniref:Putative membrane protein n=2 Tax=Cesiribacter TaxID=1133570 RepID=M7N7I7_9BACT|nr:putative membrane protein [Cesiribacter andamanensis AMV16]
MGNYSAPVDQQMAGYPDWLLQAIRNQRESMVRGDAFRTLIFVLLSAGVVYLMYLRKLGALAGGALIGLLLLVDLWMVDARYLDDSKYSRDPRRQFFAASAADQAVLADTDPHYRVLNLLNPFNEARTSYHHRSVGGYHGAKLRRYQDLISRALEPEINQLIGQLQEGAPNFEEADVLNMLDTRYLLAGQQQEAVIRNPAALGAAWLVDKVQAAQSPNEEITYLQQLDTRTAAVINTARFPLQAQSYTTEGSISLQQYDLNHIVYEAETAGNALAVFSEIYYPDGWVATINGEPAPILQANYVLRALELPAGRSTIEFRFEPGSYASGNVVMLICNIILIGLFLAALVWTVRAYRTSGNTRAGSPSAASDSAKRA